jgi:hypothetical protein
VMKRGLNAGCKIEPRMVQITKKRDVMMVR